MRKLTRKLVMIALAFGFSLALLPSRTASAIAYACNGPDLIAAASNGQGTATLKAKTCVEVNTVGSLKKVRAHSQFTCFLSAIATPCVNLAGHVTLHNSTNGEVADGPFYEESNKKTFDWYSNYWCGNYNTYLWHGKGHMDAGILANGEQTNSHNHNSFETFRACSPV